MFYMSVLAHIILSDREASSHAAPSGGKLRGDSRYEHGAAYLAHRITKALPPVITMVRIEIRRSQEMLMLQRGGYYEKYHFDLEH